MIGRFVQHRLQGSNPDTPIANDLGGGGGGTTQTIQKSDPWSGVQPFLSDVFNRAQGISQSQNGPYIAPQSPYTQQAIQQQAQAAQDPNGLVSQAQNQLGQTLGGSYLSADSNPYFQGAVQQALNQVRQNVNSQFSGDNYGSSGNQEFLAKKLADTALPYYASNYQQERQNQLNATQAAPGLQQANSSQLANAGAAQDAYNQAAIQANQQGPWTPLQNYAQLLSAGNGYGTSTSQSPYYTNPAANALGLGLGGLSLYNGLTTAGLLGGGAAAAAGGATAADLAGAGLMSFSDIRLKSNIKKLYDHKLRFGVYEYDILGIPGIGVMAQEVERVIKKAVKTMRCGLKLVDYAEIESWQAC